MDPVNFARIDASDEWVDAAEAVGATNVFIHPYVYNPLIAKLTAPLTGSHDFQWFLTWNLVLITLGIVAMVWGSVELVRQATNIDLWRPDVVAALLAALSLCEPIRLGIWLGQNSAIIGGCAILGIALARKHPAIAGALIAIAATIKLTPLALVVVLLVFRKTRLAGVWAAGWTAVCGLATYFISGHELISLWIGRLRFISEGIVLEPVNQSFSAVLGRFAFGERAQIPGLPLFEVPAWTGAVALAAGWLVICVALAVSLTAPKQARYPVLIIAALMWPLIFASIAWSHYMALVLPAVLLYTTVAWHLPQPQRKPALVLPILIGVLLLTRVAFSVTDQRLPSGTMFEVPEASFFAVVLAYLGLFLVPMLMKRAGLPAGTQRPGHGRHRAAAEPTTRRRSRAGQVNDRIPTRYNPPR
nr:glycosyltransferase family 87 protein [Corynebacterium sp. TAE3-ERU12]